MGRARTAALVTVVVIAFLVAAAAGFLGVWSGRQPPAPTRTPTPPVPSLIAGATGSPTAPPTTPAGTPPLPAALARALAPLAAAGPLGGRLRASVMDVATGRTLYARQATVPTAPASTAKLLTAAAVLTVDKPTDRFTTTLRRGPGNTLVLVGGGDPTLSAGRTPLYPGAASLRALARTVTFTPSRIVVDGGLFTGPTVSPSWAAEDVPSDYASAITAVMVDGGRAAPTDTVRSAAPDLAAGRQLAAALGRPGLPVARGTATGPVVGTVRSADVATLVAQMLEESDNVIAEVLARHVAIALKQPASFAGGVVAVRQALRRIGVDPGTGLLDGSGLAAADRVAPAVLSALLRRIAVSGPTAVLAGLPVAAWSGTLADRYVSSAARGDIRAKTGTLTGVSSLAGLVHDRDGRLLAFSFVTDRAGATLAAESALDALTSRLAACGCR